MITIGILIIDVILHDKWIEGRRHKYPYKCIFTNTIEMLSSTNFLIMLFPSPWLSSQFISYRPWKSEQHLTISPSKRNIWPHVMPEALPDVKVSLHQCLPGLSLKGVAIHSCSLLGVPAQHAETSANQALVFFFLNQSIIGHTKYDYGCILCIVTGVETMGIWASSLWNSLMASEPACAWSLYNISTC